MSTLDNLTELEEKFVDLLNFVPNKTPDSVYGDDLEVNEDAPFFSEEYLYNHLGKQDARTLLHLLNEVMKENGMDRRNLMRKARLKKKIEDS